MRISSTGAELKKKEGITVLNYGLPGVGKTNWLSQWPGLLYLSIEGGARSIQRELPMIYIEGYNDLVELTAAGQLWTPEKKEIKIRDTVFQNIETIGVDTIDEYCRLVMLGVLQMSRKETPTFQDWQLGINRMSSSLKALKNLKEKGLNIVFIAHEEYEKSDMTSTLVGQPNLPGRELPQTVSGWMDIVVHMITKPAPDGKSINRCLITQQEGVFFGRDRTWKLNRMEPADGPDAGFANFWKKVNV